MKESILAIVTLLIILGVFLLWCKGRVEHWKRRAACTEAITARLEKKSVSGVGRGERYRRHFQFTYVYHGSRKACSLDEPNKKDYKRYKEGEEYTIYVNPEHFQDIRYRKLEKKYSFLLYALRGFLLLISIATSFSLTMINIQNMEWGITVTFFDWLAPVFWVAVLIGCIVSINRD